MTAPRILKARPLTPEAFGPFGEAIQEEGASRFAINGGSTLRFNDLARVETGAEGRPLVSLFRAVETITLPYRLPLIECHPLGSQAFIPREGARFLIVVAPPAPTPDLHRLEAFLTDGVQGVNYRAGVWHLPLASFIEASYVVVDRGGPGENLREYELSCEEIVVTA